MSSPSHEKRMEHVGPYLIQNRIGQGSFATVYKAQHKDTQYTVAIKCVKRSKLTKKLLENLESEISILTAIRHENIVGLIECQKTESNIFLVMEFCSLGDLSHYIKEIRTHKSAKGRAGGLPERVVRHFLKQLANALQFLRSQNLIHRDIKPQNLLLAPAEDKDELPTLKIADFGFARFLPNASLADTLCGSPLYMGPEILSYKKYDAKADLWSVGAVLYEMVTGRPPFRAQNHIELLKKIQENNDQIHFPDEKHPDIIIGSDLKDLIRKLLKKNPVERLSFEDFFQHPAVKSIPTPTTSSNTRIQSSSTLSRYEPPPFAQMNPKPLSEYPTRRWSSGNELKHHHQEISPLYLKDRPKPETWSPSESIMKKKSGKKEEDMLHDYVVLDIRSIETNQFADELKATPRNVYSYPNNESENNAITHAMNIPLNNQQQQYHVDKKTSNPPSPSSPFMRERKSSTGSSAGSALAKALSKASVRLFGTSMPSPPKEEPHLFVPTNHRTMKKIERLACMANAVAKYGDQKYELYQKEATSLLAEETVAIFVKALALLEKGLYIAQQYWHQEVNEDEDERKVMTEPLNDAVQWMRDKFNECLDKAESIKIETSDQTCVEKLLYDKALEMSRAAAVHELVGENMTGCEQDYQTAIWMLEAILQVRPNGEVTVEEDDQRIINKFIDSIRHRITVLRKKRASERTMIF